MLPQRLDPVGVLAGGEFGDLVGQDVVHRAAVAADGIGIAYALGAIRVGPGDERDDITLTRRLDDRTLTPDPRN